MYVRQIQNNKDDTEPTTSINNNELEYTRRILRLISA